MGNKKKICDVEFFGGNINACNYRIDYLQFNSDDEWLDMFYDYLINNLGGTENCEKLFAYIEFYNSKNNFKFSVILQDEAKRAEEARLQDEAKRAEEARLQDEAKRADGKSKRKSKRSKILH